MGYRADKEGIRPIGRALGAGGTWHGALADVRVWDRVVVGDEAAAAAKRAVVSKGYWELHRWQMVLADEDTAGAETTTITAENASAYTGSVQHVALVYDDGADEIRLYVDGQLSARTAYSYASKATGALQIGRALTAEGWGEYTDGRVDEVHTYAGVLTETQIAQLRAGATDV